MRFTVSQAPHQNLNPTPNQRGAQLVTGSHQPRRPAPPTLTTSLTSSPNVAARAQTSPTNEMAASGPSPSAVSGSTRSSFIPLSLYSRYHIHSKENPLDLTLDVLFDLNNGTRARSSRAFRSRSGERKTNWVNPNPNETITLTLIPNRQRTKKNTARSKDKEGERGKGIGGGLPELDRRPPVARLALT